MSKDIEFLEHEVKRLQAENERLNSTCLQLQSSELKQHLEKVNCERENYKFRKALEEIREICKKETSHYDRLIEIVTKVGEVLDERN